MTAPDDVRARFEAWVQRNGPQYMERDRYNGDYLSPCLEATWRGYRAAHADLSGEVRELDENAKVREALAGKKLYVMHPEHIADVHKPMNEITFGMVMDDKVLFACKQPAKHTHQEKP